MHITFTFNTEYADPSDIRVLQALAGALQPRSSAAANPQPQPEVGENTGTSSTGITLSPGAAGVGEGAGAPASAGQQATPSAPETSAPPAEKRTRKPKEAKPDFPVQRRSADGATGPFYWSHPESSSLGVANTVEELEAVLLGDGNAAEVTKEQYDKLAEELRVAAIKPEAKPDTKLTIDDVRAKLQAFTGAKGIDAGLALLGEFKAGRISELKAEDYLAFVAKCEVTA